MIDDPLFVSGAVCAALVAGTWTLSVLTREYSWVDRIWSVAPPVYAWIFAVAASFDPRSVLVAALITAWGARLTFNYARKGGYAPGGEDYRWAILRERLGPVGFQLFNATFIAPYQNLLILGMTLPVYEVWRHRGEPLGPVDVGLAALFVAFLVGEFVADQQQWEFHQEKRARRERGEPVGTGFCDVGLWRYSRHPNFVCEFSQWWVVYAFGVAAGASPLNATIAGAVLLTLLFDGSTRFTESITASKYPEYADYQRRTSRWVPWPPRA